MAHLFIFEVSKGSYSAAEEIAVAARDRLAAETDLRAWGCMAGGVSLRFVRELGHEPDSEVPDRQNAVQFDGGDLCDHPHPA